MTDIADPIISAGRLPGRLRSDTGRVLSLREVRQGLYRATDARGAVCGHIQIIADGASTRYRARRLDISRGGFVDFGDFWSAEAAASALPR